MLIKSSDTLSKDYEAFSKLAHKVQEPIFITKEGEGDLVLMTIEVYEKICRNSNLEGRKSAISKEEKVDVEVSDMTENRLGKILRELYDSAARGHQVANIHTFAIYYANVIEKNRLSKKEILRVAGLPETYQTEISKGINLAQYVDVKNDVIERIQKIEATIGLNI